MVWYFLSALDALVLSGCFAWFGVSKQAQKYLPVTPIEQDPLCEFLK